MKEGQNNRTGYQNMPLAVLYKGQKKLITMTNTLILETWFQVTAHLLLSSTHYVKH